MYRSALLKLGEINCVYCNNAPDLQNEVLHISHCEDKICIEANKLLSTCLTLL